MYGAYIYDTVEILLRTDGRTDERTNKAILGVGFDIELHIESINFWA